jgi:hypothetical protein
MKYIITEQQYKRLNKSSETLSKAIVKHMNQYISYGERKVTNKSRNYGNLREDWCVDGKEVVTAIYFFEDGKFNTGSMYVSKELVESLSNLLSIRKLYVLHIILEWYDEVMVPKFEQIVGESGLSIDDIDTSDKDHECIPEPVKPEGITDEEMIDFIDKNTGYRRQEIIDKIESGERDLEDFYLDIVDTAKRKEILGF